MKSTNPLDRPKIVFNYMSTQQDRAEMRDGIRLTREILSQAAFNEFRGRELSPGRSVQTDAQIDEFVREKGESAYHPSCTCAMGEKTESVVDKVGRVHGLYGLRIVDASIMPNIISGNLNAPTIMLAEKIADQIRGRKALPRETRDIWVNPNYEKYQR